MKTEEQGMDGLKIFLAGMSSLQAKEKSVARFLLEKGEVFRGQVLAEDYELGRAKLCYANASMLVLGNRALRYVEGYVLLKKVDYFPIEHAWAVDSQGRVIDNTLGKVEGNLYFGVCFTAQDLMEWLMKSEVYGVFGGRRQWVESVLAGNSLAVACGAEGAEMEEEKTSL